MLSKLFKQGFIVIFFVISSQAAVIESNKNVVVMPLWFSYQVRQDYQYSYAKVESSLKGYANEKSSDSYRESARDGRYSASQSGSSKESFNGKYDLKSNYEVTAHSGNDTTIVEKILDTEKYTGIIESALSEAGVRVGNRELLGNINSEQQDSEILTKRAIQNKIGDYVLTGDVTSLRMGGIRKVPDGTNRRYSVDSTLKISIKITNIKNGVSHFARTFTGKGVKTFDADDYIPSEETMDMAMDAVAMQLTAALTGQTILNPSESDAEYQDSPGKRLID